jgi:alpha-L-rhamnosidase
LYPVKMGATTIWERWDGIKPDSTFQTPSMNSYNHYSYGAIGDWMYRVVAGIDTYEDGVGYKHIRIMPHIGGGLTDVSAALQTYYGQVSSHWKVENDRLVFDVEIPSNTSATIYIPATKVDDVSENGGAVTAANEIQLAGTEKEYVVVKTGSGKYHFEVKK